MPIPKRLALSQARVRRAVFGFRVVIANLLAGIAWFCYLLYTVRDRL